MSVLGFPVSKMQDCTETSELPKDLAQASVQRRAVQTTDEDNGNLSWVLTFTDIMALMLTFFVLMYSMSEPRHDQWERMSAGLNAELRKYYTPPRNLGDHESVNVTMIDFSEALNLDYLTSVLRDIVEKDTRLSAVDIIPQREALIVSIPQHVLFEKGKTQISAGGREVLTALAAALNRIRNRIEVVGHADPFSGESKAMGLPSDWELSLLRAGAVASILHNAGYRRSVSFRGFSSGRYSDMPMDVEEPQKRALSQRLEIVLMKDDGTLRSGAN
jgi:chemotaxis protein MotB